jgi:hypothetical protein
MRLRVALLAILGAAVLAPAAGAKLTPKEQAWVTPLLKIWNTQYAAGGLVPKQAQIKGSLVAGTKANETLVGTLAALVDCKEPHDRIKAAGSPPTTRLGAFQTELNAACKYDLQGANLVAKAMGAVRLGKISLANSRLQAGVAELYKGRRQLAKAYEAITKLGHGNGLSA